MSGPNEPTTGAPSRSCLLCGRGLKTIHDETGDVIDERLEHVHRLAEVVLVTLPESDQRNRVSLNLIRSLLDDVRVRRMRARLMPKADGED
jgi:hypothetical protein